MAEGGAATIVVVCACGTAEMAEKGATGATTAKLVVRWPDGSSANDP